MKRKLITSLLAVVIACSALFALPAAAVADSTVPTFADGYDLFETQMFLGAWCEPEGTEQQMAYFAECGFNVVYLKEEQRYDGSMLYHQLDLLDKYGIKAMLGMSSGRLNGQSWRISENSLEHSAIIGLCSCDEPLGNGDREFVGGQVNPKFEVTLSREKSAETGWQEIYEKSHYNTTWDFLYYDGMTYLYGRDESQFFIDGVTNVNAPAGQEIVPLVASKVSEANNPVNGYKVGTNSDAYKAATGDDAATFNRIFTSVLSNRAEEGTFGYSAMKSYCESVLAGKHDVNYAADDTMPVPQEDRFIEIDYYPYSVDDRTGAFKISESYLNRLMEYRYYIDAYDVPMTNVYYQNWFDDALMPYIDEAALTQQFYTIMTYGIKGLTVWYYNMYWSDYKTSNNVMVDEFCNRTDLWFYNEAAFNEIEAFDNVYLTFCDPDNWQGILTLTGTVNQTEEAALMYNQLANGKYTFGRPIDNYDVFDFEGSTMTPTEAKAFAEGYVANHSFTASNLPSGVRSATSTGDATVGILKNSDLGLNGYVITNQNFIFDRLENDVTLDFAGATRAMVWNAGQYELVNLDNGVLNLHLGVGDGAFVIPLA